jgi:dTDP-4-dehydrorhamnose 3,5-epimerase
MNLIETPIPGLMVIEPRQYRDSRGCFFEPFNLDKFKRANLECNFCQDNHSESVKGVIRGLHYQLAPYAQTKLIRVVYGKVFDVAVDIRSSSPTFGNWYGIELSDENNLQLYIPKGFAHGFSALSKKAVLLYKVDNFYNKESERGILYNDNSLDIDWKVKPDDTLLSPRDIVLPTFENAEMNFIYGNS